MLTSLHWIDIPKPGRLAIMPRPRAGDWLRDEIDNWNKEGVKTIVSLLETAEILELGLDDEQSLCVSAGIEFISYPITDRSVPRSLNDTISLAHEIVIRMDESHDVAVHCRAGIGRSALIAACALIYRGTTAEAALDLIAGARGIKVPDTDAQRDWIFTFLKKYRAVFLLPIPVGCTSISCHRSQDHGQRHHPFCKCHART